MNYRTCLPRLVFMINDNHLYPITDETTRETIFKTSSIIGGGIKKHKVQQKIENEKLKISERTKNIMHDENMNFNAFYDKHNKEAQENPEYNYKMIITKKRCSS